MYTGFSGTNPRDGDHLEEPVVEWSLVLRWILRKWNVGH